MNLWGSPTWKANRRARADAMGLCRDCCETPRLPGRLRCSDCTLAKREYMQRRRERLAAAGLCRECGTAPRTRGVRCDACARANVERVNAARSMVTA